MKAMYYLFMIGLLLCGWCSASFAARTSRPLGDPIQTSLACNETTGEYLVVWKHHNDPACDLWGQIIRADGTRKKAFFISSKAYGEFIPEVVFNPLQNEYLVVWAHQSGTLSRIYGTLVAPASEKHLPRHGHPDSTFIIYDESLLTSHPKAAFNSTHNSYLICWTEGITESEKSIPLLVTQQLDRDGFLANTYVLPLQPETTSFPLRFSQQSIPISFYPSYGKQLDEWFVMLYTETQDPVLADISGIRFRGSDGQPIGIWDTMQAYWRKL